MNLIINSNRARRLPFLSKKPLPANEVIGPYPEELKSNRAFRAARDRGLITIVSEKTGAKKVVVKAPPTHNTQRSSGTTSIAASSVKLKEVKAAGDIAVTVGAGIGPLVASTIPDALPPELPGITPKTPDPTVENPAENLDKEVEKLAALLKLTEKNISEIKVEIMSGDIDIKALIEIEKANKKRVSLISFLEQLL